MILKPLYTSADLHREIRLLFQSPKPKEKRIAVVAYVSAASSAYLPSPEGLRVICSPEPGFTSGNALRDLIRRGASVEFADKLHAKVYWSKQRGCVVSSANLSASALAAGGLKEAGVWLSPGKFDIQRLVRAVSPRAVTAADLRRLDNAPMRFRTTKQEQDASAQFDFGAWYESRDRRPWRMAWWMDNELEPAAAARRRSQREYGLREPHDYMNVAKGQAAEGDWLLCFELGDKKLRKFTWLYTDFVVPVGRKEKAAFEAEYPFQAVQVHPPRRNPEPPFAITDSFKRAFNIAARGYGLSRVEAETSTVPPPQVVKETYLGVKG